ncbi:MAG: nicotinate phosphoribosyltransferase [Rhodobacteraceae bacterium]|nr:nicotinate phosphoribosyltransferase [Paracoccaceae bacterium]
MAQSVDIATRVYNHNWKIDPIVRSLIDTDFYKLLMCQFVQKTAPDVRVKFQIIDRDRDHKVAKHIDHGELREQLDNIRSLRLTRGESTWLRGNMFYGRRQMFAPEFIDWLENLTLPDYSLDSSGGKLDLCFEGKWPEVMLWEIPALATLTELNSRSVLKSYGKFELQVLYARAMTRLWDKITAMSPIETLQIADFGTRRRHSYLWQDWCVQAMISGLGDRFIGTSNCHIAMQREVEAIGTHAHELTMAYGALSTSDDELRSAPFRMMEDWKEVYGDNLRVILPDTFGSGYFYALAPQNLAAWTTIRIDSGDPVTMAEQALSWWDACGEDPREKLIIFSDGLDVDTILALQSRFQDRVRVSHGWGTLLTNDFRQLDRDDRLAPVSLVCKLVEVNGRMAVKLSDNPEKATGPSDAVARYRNLFRV